MADIVIVNPSFNMKMLARELVAIGKKVMYVSVSELPYFSPKKIFYFFSGCSTCFTDKAEKKELKDNRIYMFNRGLFSSLSMRNVSKDLIKIDPGLSKGIFTDLMMFYSNVLRRCDDHKETVKEFSDVESVCKAYPDANIFSTVVPGGNTLKLCRWETDYDLGNTFASDYYVFIDDETRVEAFCFGDCLCTVGEGDINHIALMSKVIPTLSRFMFNKISEKNIFRVTSPWIMKNSQLGVTLVNDYSFLGTSINMPSLWYSRFATFIKGQTIR